MVILITMPCGMGTEEIQSVSFGWSLGYTGRLSVFSITGPHPGRKRTKMQSWHGRTNSLFTMALKSLIVVVRCQFIFLYIFIFLILFVNVVKDIYLFTHLFILFFFYFLFQFQNPSRALQATSRYQNTQHASSHFYASHLHIFYISNDFDFYVLFT